MRDARDFPSSFIDISPYYFEHLVADIWEAQGWNSTVTSLSQDFGIDIVVERPDPYPQKKLIQVKCYSDGNNVSGPEVREIAGLHQQEPDADSVIIVTSSDFTQNAVEVANRSNVKLINGESLSELVIDSGSETDVKKYRDLSETETESEQQKRERLYQLLQKRSTEIEIDSMGPGTLHLYFSLNGVFTDYYEQIANHHTLRGLSTAMATQVEKIAEREEMSVDWYRNSEPYSLGIMCANRYQKGTEEHRDYHFSIIGEILSDVYDIGIQGIDWAVVSGAADIHFTWTDI